MTDDDIAKIRHFALDLDGTVYKGKTLFPFTRPFLETLAGCGIGYTFFTNNSSKSVSDYVTHLDAIGIEATAGQIYTSTLASIAYLRRNFPSVNRIYILGTNSMAREFEQAGFVSCEEDPELVVVGFDPELDFQRLCRAGYWIAQGKPFIATHPDKVCPTDEPTLLVDCGSVCAALHAATGRHPEAVPGKPHPLMIEGILQRHQLQPEELAVAGDRLYTDLAMATAVGAWGVLVLTGETSREEGERAQPPPDLILKDLGVLIDRLKAVRTGS